MIKEENLNTLYEEVINKEKLTTKELNDIGFTSKDLTNLVDNNILIRVKRGIYIFNDVDNLFLYARKILANKETEKFKKTSTFYI